MIDIRILRQHGLKQSDLKKIFTAKTKDKKVQDLIDTMVARADDGMASNLEDYPTWYAIDRAYDLPFYQKSKALLEGLMSMNPSSETIVQAVNDLGLGSIYSCSCGASPCTNRLCAGTKTLDCAGLIELGFPIVRSYTNVRWARIYNDLNLVPLLKYEAAFSTAEQRLGCELITARVQQQGQQLGYGSYLRQFILQALQYSACMVFPKESWYHEKQLRYKDGKKKETEEFTSKEGVRYDHPHPTRFYVDPGSPTYTSNTDSGVQFAGYWKIDKYGDIEDDPELWNTDKITFGPESFRITSSNQTFFRTVYPCAMSFPAWPRPESTDREEKSARYSSSERDSAVLIRNHFQKLVPKDHGIGTYPYPIWTRTKFASDDTVLHFEPFPYNPLLFFGCDVDANRANNVGLSHEVIPYQEMVGNVITQWLLSIQQNLTNVVFVNEDVLDESVVKQLKASGGNRWRNVLTCVPFSEYQSRIKNIDHSKALLPIQIPQKDTTQLIVVVRSILDLLDRTLGMSAVEIGVSAPHEESAAEVGLKAQSTSTRLGHTTGFMSDGVFAWQNQLFHAGMNYWDDEIVGQIAVQSAADKEVLKKLGFEIEDTNEEFTVGVRGKKRNLDITGFTVRRDAADRMNNTAVAAAMVQLFQVFINNPVMVQSVGVEQIVATFNSIARMAGLPRDFMLKVKTDPLKDGANPEQQANELKGQLDQLAQKLVGDTSKMVLGEMEKSLVPALQKLAQKSQEQEQSLGQLGPAMQALAQKSQEQEQAIIQNAQQTAETQQALAQVMQGLKAMAQQAQVVEQPMPVPVI